MAETKSSDMSIRQIESATGRAAKTNITVVEFLDRRLIDTAQIERLGNQLMQIVKAEETPKLVISFRMVEYLSSTMLNLLIEFDNTIKRTKGQLRLADLDPELLKVFTLMKLHKVMMICKTADEAIGSLKS
jgi:anti-sigma B factor antagonist